MGANFHTNGGFYDMAIPLKEVGFGPDAFDDPTTHDALQSLGILIYRIFVMRPGTLPSMPNIGIDIRKYMYRPEGSIDKDGLRNKIFANCSDLLYFMNLGDIVIEETTVKGQLTLVVVIRATISQKDYALLIALRKGLENEVTYSFRAESLALAEQ